MFVIAKQKISQLVNSTAFMILISGVILINSALIGVQTHFTSSAISSVQEIILLIFTFEIILRFIGKKSAKEYFTNGWNVFDLFLVAFCYIPEAWVTNAAILTIFRIVRVFRVLRIIKIFPELRIIVVVFFKSLKSLCYTSMILLIFMYMYAITGVMLFKGGTAANIGAQNPDPYGSITEAFFTLFRITTGDAWVDLRYDLLGDQVAGTSDFIVSAFHVSWIGLSAFLLINLVIGAIVNNYDDVKSKEKGPELDINLLYKKIDSLDEQLKALKAELNK